MAKPKLVWVAWMSRWGEPSPTHAYAAGVFSCNEKAREAGEAEGLDRGGKYVFQHCPAYLDLHSELGFDLDGAYVFPRVGKAPKKVYVAWVEAHNRCHFLGVFSTRKKARLAGPLLYPGWEVEVTRFVVDAIMEL